MNNSDMKALYIVVNAGFAEQVVDFIRSKGVSGATILNARGIRPMSKEIMGISMDTDKEMILTLTTTDIANKIMAEVKEKSGFKSDAHGVCFALPVSKTVGLSDYSISSTTAEK